MTSFGDNDVAIDHHLECAAEVTSNDVIAELTIPARYRQVRLARLLAGGVAAQLDLDLDRVEEFRLTVDELCAVLLECAVSRDATDDRITIRFETSRDQAGVPERPAVVVSARRHSSTIVDQPSAITAAILDSMCSGWGVSGSTVHATLSTSTPAAPHVHR